MLQALYNNSKLKLAVVMLAVVMLAVVMPAVVITVNC